MLPDVLRDCRGRERKERILRAYELRAVCHAELLPGSEILGCCGPLEREYYVFIARPRDGSIGEHVIQMGSTRAAAFLEMTGQPKLPLVSLLRSPPAPPREPGPSGPTCTPAPDPLTRQALYAAHVLLASWRSQPKSALAGILAELTAAPHRPPSQGVLRGLNRIISFDTRKRTLEQMRDELGQAHERLKRLVFDDLDAAIRRLGVESMITKR